MRMKILRPLIGCRSTITGRRFSWFLAGGAVEDAVVVGRDDIDARLPAAAAADEEAGDRGA